MKVIKAIAQCLLVWLAGSALLFLAMYLIGSFCTWSLDITQWTSGFGRFWMLFGSLVPAGFLTGIGYEVTEAARINQKELAEREAARALQQREYEESKRHYANY